MQFVRQENRYIIRLSKGEGFNEKLLDFCEQENINTAFFNGLGAVLSAELGFYDLENHEYKFQAYTKTQEIPSLVGNITLVDNKPFIHAHVVLSDENFECRGGHLKDAIVGGTCEIYLFNEDLNLERKFDQDTGLKLINCKINK